MFTSEIVSSRSHVGASASRAGCAFPPTFPGAASAARPLWLTEQEAALLVQMCAATPLDAAHQDEDRLFEKLGSLLRDFRR